MAHAPAGVDKKTTAVKRTAAAANPKERVIVKRIERFLRTLNAKVLKTWGSPYASRGEPDLVGVVTLKVGSLGVVVVPFAFEVKRVTGGRTSELQEYRLKEWYQAGACASVVRNVEMVKEALIEYVSNEFPVDSEFEEALRELKLAFTFKETKLL